MNATEGKGKMICRFWDEKKKECIWNFLLLYYWRNARIITGATPFQECTDGLNEYHPHTMNTKTTCHFYLPKEEQK